MRRSVWAPAGAGTDYNWGVANWYEDGEGSNKRVRRNLSGYQFTAATGEPLCHLPGRANSGDAYTSKSGNGWDNKTAYPPADLASAYFTVNGLTAASDVTAAQDGTHPAAARGFGVDAVERPERADHGGDRHAFRQPPRTGRPTAPTTRSATRPWWRAARPAPPSK